MLPYTDPIPLHYISDSGFPKYCFMTKICCTEAHGKSHCCWQCFSTILQGKYRTIDTLTLVFCNIIFHEKTNIFFNGKTDGVYMGLLVRRKCWNQQNYCHWFLSSLTWNYKTIRDYKESHRNLWYHSLETQTHFSFMFALFYFFLSLLCFEPYDITFCFACQLHMNLPYLDTSKESERWLLLKK